MIPYLTDHRLFQSLPIGLALCRLDGQIVECNPAFAAILGRTIDEVMALTYWQITPEDYAIQEQLQLAQLTEKGTYGPYEKEYWHRDGHRVPVRLQGSLVTIDDEQLIWSSVENIAPLKQAEAALRRERDNLEAKVIERVEAFRHQAEIIDQIPDAVVSTDLQGIVQSWNQGASRIFGYTAEEIIGRHLSVLCVAEDQTLLLDDIIKPLQQQGRHEAEVRVRHQTGRVFWVQLRLFMQYDEHQQPLRMVGYSVDITDRLRARDMLLEKEVFLRLILEHLPVALFCKDSQNEFRFTLWNRTSELLFGLPSAQMLGRNDYDFFPVEQADFFRSKDREVMASNQVVEIPEEFIDSPSLGRLTLHTIKVAVPDATGQPRYLLGISENITERKKMERIKNDFVSTVSHELRTPLTSIRGALGLVAGGAMGEVSEPQRNLLGMAVRNSERLTRLINDLLDMEKIAAGRMRFELAVDDLGVLTRDIVEAGSAAGAARQVRLVQEIDDAPLPVTVDAERYSQILNNLLSNALKFAPAQSEVRVQVQRLGKRGRVTISDQGPGVPTEFHERIFQRFSQADSSNTREKGGSGLGLAITKELAEHMYGRVGFSSEPGQGASFWVEFPLQVG